MHAEHASPADPDGAGGTEGRGGYGERAETYLRLLAEAALRPFATRDADLVCRAGEAVAVRATGSSAGGLTTWTL